MDSPTTDSRSLSPYQALARWIFRYAGQENCWTGAAVTVLENGQVDSSPPGQHCRYTARVVDSRHVTLYSMRMIKTFADRHTQELYATGKSKRFPADIGKRAPRKLEYVDLAMQLNDLKVPPGNRLHALEGNRKGQHSISINDQWRVCFRFVAGDAYDVEICDYH